MKTKLSFLLAVIFILSMIVTSCGEVTTTVQTTVPQNSNGSWGMYTTYDTLEEFLYDINNPYDNDKNEQLQQSDAKMFEHFKDRGKVHYVEVKFDEYLPDFIYLNLNLGLLQHTAYSKYYLCRKHALHK